MCASRAAAQPAEPVVVDKFGGSVLRRPEDIAAAVAAVAEQRAAGLRPVVVVSAFEGVTDAILGSAARTPAGPGRCAARTRPRPRLGIRPRGRSGPGHRRGALGRPLRDGPPGAWHPRPLVQWRRGRHPHRGRAPRRGGASRPAAPPAGGPGRRSGAGGGRLPGDRHARRADHPGPRGDRPVGRGAGGCAARCPLRAVQGRGRGTGEPTRTWCRRPAAWTRSTPCSSSCWPSRAPRWFIRWRCDARGAAECRSSSGRSTPKRPRPWSAPCGSRGAQAQGVLMLAVDRKERIARISLVGPAPMTPELLPLPAHGEGASTRVDCASSGRRCRSSRPIAPRRRSTRRS